MKIIKTYFPVLLILLFTGVGILSAQPEKNQDEYLNTLLRSDEEENVNDIPFNTAAIASEALFHKLVKTTFSREQEKRINDIPFNTREIAEQHLLQEKYKSIFKEKEEAYIDDIPPAILKGMKSYQQKLLTSTIKK